MNRFDIDLSVITNAPYLISVSFEVRFISEDHLKEWMDNHEGNFFSASLVEGEERDIKIETIPLSKDVLISTAIWAPLMASLSGIASIWDAVKPLTIRIDNKVLKGKDVENFSKVWYFYEYLMRGDSICENSFSRSVDTFRGTSQLAIDVSLLGEDVLKDTEIRERLSEEMIAECQYAGHHDLLCLEDSNRDVVFVRPRASTMIKRVVVQIELLDLMVRYAVATPLQQLGCNDFIEWIRFQKTTTTFKEWFGWRF
jgi:hypothetical protein